MTKFEIKILNQFLAKKKLKSEKKFKNMRTDQSNHWIITNSIQKLKYFTK